MRISDIVHRELPPRPRAEGDKIPWSDAGFVDVRELPSLAGSEAGRHEGLFVVTARKP